MHNKVLLIMAQDGFLYKGSQHEGYDVCHPYNPCNVIQRLLREFVFRFIPSMSSFFYNKKAFEGDWNSILIWDPLITKRYIEALHKTHSQAQIHFIYWNMVGKARHLYPAQIPLYVNKWTYDEYDSEKYGLKLYTSYPYYSCFIQSHKEILYDVLFVGKDKGRGDFLLELEKKLKDAGLKTKFIITKSSRFSKRKSYYQPEVSYDDLCDLISHSRAVLNVVMENQKGLTLRDLEYVFQKVKLITTNQFIINNSIYNPNNVFIIKNGHVDGIAEFMGKPFMDLPSDIIKHHKFDSFIEEITFKDE